MGFGSQRSKRFFAITLSHGRHQATASPMVTRPWPLSDLKWAKQWVGLSKVKPCFTKGCLQNLLKHPKMTCWMRMVIFSEKISDFHYVHSTENIRIMYGFSYAKVRPLYANLRPLYGCTGMYGFVRTQYVLSTYYGFSMGQRVFLIPAHLHFRSAHKM